MLAQTSTSIQDAALFAEMLSLPNDGRYPAPDLTPQQRRQRSLEALVSQMEALTRQNPVLMIFQDAHWTDPTSLEGSVGSLDARQYWSYIVVRQCPTGGCWFSQLTLRPILSLLHRDLIDVR